MQESQASISGGPTPVEAQEALAAVAHDLGIADVQTAASPADALTRLAETQKPRIVLILGSLYLAGGVLAANDEPPD